MKTERSLVCGLILLLALSAGVPARAQQAGETAAARHSLWKVDGGSNAVYLLGSVHLLKASDYPLAAPIETAFAGAQVAVFEADIGQMGEPATQMKMLAKARLPEGQTLSQQVTPATYALFTNQVSKAGLPALVFDQLQPFMAVSMLEVLELQQLGVDPQYGLDEHFFDQARKQGKRIVPLETVEFQIDLVTDLSRDEGEQLMKSTLKTIDNTRQEYKDIVAAWRTGDSAAIEKLLNESMKETPVIFKRFVADRSRNWVPKIKGLLHDGKDAIVIVGAGHLVGKDGVVELLRKDGLKVSQL